MKISSLAEQIGTAVAKTIFDSYSKTGTRPAEVNLTENGLAALCTTAATLAEQHLRNAGKVPS